MNNEQIEQPVSVDEQADNIQGNGSSEGAGSASIYMGAEGTEGGASDAGREGSMPTDMPGDMLGPMPHIASEGGAEGATGAALPYTDAANVSPDLDTGYVDAATAEATGTDDTGDTAGTNDTSGVGDGTAIEQPSVAEAPMPAGDATQPETPQPARQTAPQSPRPMQQFNSEQNSGGDGEDGDSGELVIRQARDPRMDNVAANASMEDLLKASEQQYRTLKQNDVIEGTVMRVDRDEVLVDIGAKTEGIIPNRELQSLSQEERDAMQPGDPVLVAVVQPENNEGHALLSLDRARQERSWRDLQRKFEAGEVIQAPVSGHNKGGLLVNIEGVRGFVPSSQISSLPPGPEANKQAELSRYHNQNMSLKIIEINRNRNRLILSERQAMQEQRESIRTRLLKELESGQIRPGTVTSIADFGAFVDIGGADGLIHLSELSWKRVAHPSEVLKVGERINVYVLSVDPHERKIALSLKRTQPEPWTTITENYAQGQVVRGTITQLTSFGAFARLDDGIEGLIHVSELAEGRVAHPRSVVKEGDVVDLKVIRIDPIKRRIGLSLKQMQEDVAQTPGEPGAYGEEGVYEPGAVASQQDDSKPGLRVDTEMDPSLSRQEHAMSSVQAPAPEPSQPLPARQAQFQRERGERGEGGRDGGGRDRDRDRDRGDRDRGGRQDRGGATPQTPSEEPMSAMAQAFAAFAQQSGSLPVVDEATAATPRTRQERGGQGGQASQSAQAPQTEQAAEAPSNVQQAETPEAETLSEAPSPALSTASAEDTSSKDMPSPEEASMSSSEDTSAEDVSSPEASMPSSEDMSSAEESASPMGSDTGDSMPDGDSDTADVEAEAPTLDAGDTGGSNDAESEAGGSAGGTDEETGSAGEAGGSLNDVDAGAVADNAPEVRGTSAANMSTEVEDTSDASDTNNAGDTGTSDSGDTGEAVEPSTGADSLGAVSGSEGMPSVADSGPVDGETVGSEGEFNG